GAAVLEWLDEPLARCGDGGDMPQVHSPRPHLHPVHSLAGTALTQVSPVDHRHHYGVSFAVADVDGTSHWGGRTYVPGQGPTLLSNHGRQTAVDQRVADEGATLASDVVWTDEHGRLQLQEERALTAVVVPDEGAWVLGWRSALTAPRGATLSSPAVHGRAGAGYGGPFWRLPPADEVRVATAQGSSESEAHGSRSPWLVVNRRSGGSWSSLLLVQGTAPDLQAAQLLPWFVRATDYVGVGPALAWAEPLLLPAGERLDVALTAVVLDRWVDAADADGLARSALARLAAARGGRSG
ncbi:PmoA family protein, partial [Kineococcus glutinatus]|uniref:DUF6807 domain-containing protein n=1 Tax=Kineococcus glutinatus TaxID=1070872 RepID=UPI0031EDF8F6